MVANLMKKRKSPKSFEEKNNTVRLIKKNCVVLERLERDVPGVRGNYYESLEIIQKRDNEELFQGY